MTKKQILTRFSFIALTLLALIPMRMKAQKVLSLEKCRELALENNKKLQISQENINMAGYEKKIAFSNYLPKFSAAGTYMHNSRDISLLSADNTGILSNIGTTVQGGINNTLNSIMQQVMSDPALLNLILNSPTLQNMISQLQSVDVSEALNSIGSEISDVFNMDIKNIYAGIVTFQEPLYVGGKIRAYNKIASYAKDLAQSQLETEQHEIIVTTDKAYWQIVSIANKLKLTQSYIELIQKLNDDVDKLVNEGLATSADRLSIKVKLNEAEMNLIKVQNGLALSKMLLCQNCGLPLDAEISLEDESLEDVVIPSDSIEYTEKDIRENRPELRSLSLATDIYNKKVNIIRSEFLPTVAVFGNYIVSNPSCFNGFENEFKGMWNVGVMAKIPLFHWCEGINKIHKAKSEAKIAQFKLEDTQELIMLQVNQYEKQIREADARLKMSQEKMSDAEENLRVATIGFQEGVITSSGITEAQTAWLQAHSDYIDSKIDLIMTRIYLRKAIGILK